MNKKDLKKIWQQVPADYYEQGVKNNLLQRYWHITKVKTFKKLLGTKKPKKILDVGCASGYMTNEISKIMPQATLTGVDVYSKSLAFGKKVYPQIKFIKADAHQLPFVTSSFDLVICYEVIEHVVNPNIVLKELKRVVKKNGQVIVAMDSGNWLFRIIWFIWENTKGKVWQGAHLHPFRHQKLEEIIKKCGFRIKRKAFSHFGLEVIFVAKK